MKVIKYYEDSEASKKAMKIFDRIIGSAYYDWPLDKIEVFITDSGIGDAWIEGRNAKIFIGKDNHYIKNMDEKGTEALMLTKIFSLLIKLQGLDTSNLRQTMHSEPDMFAALLMIEDFLASRKAAKLFPDTIFYKSFDTVHRASAQNIVETVDICLSYLVFHGIDNWNSEFLERAASSKISNDYAKGISSEIIKIIDSGSNFGEDEIRKILDIAKAGFPASGD